MVRILGVLGATLVITSLFTSTITQQVIQYPSRLAPMEGVASVSRVTRLHADYSKLSDSDVTQTVVNAKRNVLSGAYTSIQETHENLPPLCSSGECEFDDFVSLGLCSQVTDVTEYLNVTQHQDHDWGLFGLSDNRTWNASLPLPLSYHTLIVPNLRTFDFYQTTEEGMSLSFNRSDLATSICDIYMIYSNGNPNSDEAITFHAVEMSWFWCAKAFSLKVTAGTSHWIEKARSVNIIESTASTLDSLHSPLYWICFGGIGECKEHEWGSVKLAPPPGFESHPPLEIEALSGIGLSAILQASFWNGVNAPPQLEKLIPTQDDDAAGWGGMFQVGRTTYRIQGDLSIAFATALWPAMAHEGGDPSRQVGSLHNLTENVAKGIENYIRSSAGQYVDNSPVVEGVALSETPYVAVRWKWLLFLILEVALSIIFLSSNVILTRSAGMQIIKGSTMATMCALDEITRKHLGGIDDLEGIQEAAKKTTVKLESTASGVGLWLSMRANVIGMR